VVQGRAWGIGTVFAAMCDVTIASRDASFRLGELERGIPPCIAMSALLDRMLSKALAWLVYSADPRKDPQARFIDEAEAGDPALELMAGGAGSSIGRGGMITKVLAAKRAAGSGASTVIAWGREPDVLLRLAAGERIGSTLVARTAKVAARKQWMVDHLQLRGAVVVDDGAVKKLRDEGKSLLPIGVVEVHGDFRRGDVIAVRSASVKELARGLANYSSTETRLIARKPSTQIEAALGYVNEPELIHRTNLVLSQAEPG
jgi:glutamate 5-kinase